MKTQLQRDLKARIQNRLFENGKIVVLYGPRQVGKTTLAKQILEENDSKEGYFNCEERNVAAALSSLSSTEMFSFFSGTKVIVLDEAQTIKNIGRALKILIDAHPEMNIIATGSSSFDLANKIVEPLTGRHYEYLLLPPSFSEITKTFGKKYLLDNLDNIILFGSYPEILLSTSISDKTEKLSSLSNSYLYRDVFKYNQIRNPEVLQNLLQALAFQVGNEVSSTELSNLLKIDKNTVDSYIRLLEQAFIVYRLSSYSNNHRNEIKKGKKIFFYDNGIVNSLTNNFSSLNSGREVGGIWENLMISERKKQNQNQITQKHSYFWRKVRGGEIDLVEEYDGKLLPFEIKYSKEKPSRSAKSFVETYSAEEIRIVNRANYFEWLVSSHS